MFLYDFVGFVLCEIAIMTLNYPMSVLYRKKTIVFTTVITIKSNVDTNYFHFDIVLQQFDYIDNCNDNVCI
jgi:hypothetical protein